MVKESTRESNLLMALLPLLVDGGAAIILLLWMPVLSARLLEPSGLNALLLVILYVLFCIGVYLSRKLLPQAGNARWLPPAWLMNPKVRGALGLLFALFLTTTFAYQLGYFESLFQIRAGLLNEGATAAFLVYAPGAWLGFAMLVILVLAFPVDTNVPADSNRYAVLALLSLIFTNSLLLFTSAQSLAMISGLALSPGMGLWLLVLAALTLSFLPARAIYQSRQPTLGGWLSFALLLLLASYLAVFG